MSTRQIIISVLLIIFGAALIRSAITGDSAAWVSQAPVVVAAAGAAVATVGAVPLIRGRLHRSGCQCDQHCHADHSGGTRWAPWALALIVLVVAGITPPSMMPMQVTDATASAAASGGAETWPDVPAGRHEMGLREVVARSTAPADERMTGREVLLTGQLTVDEQDRLIISRIAINCCAADARSYRVEILDSLNRLGSSEASEGDWITATVKLMPGSGTEARNWMPQVGLMDINPVDDPGYEVWV